jgi:hypothetical protein
MTAAHFCFPLFQEDVPVAVIALGIGFHTVEKSLSYLGRGKLLEATWSFEEGVPFTTNMSSIYQ